MSTFKIMEWDNDTLWDLDIDVTICAICRNLLLEGCLKCQKNCNEPGKKCDLACGKCNHVYHQHCIERWLEIRNICPLCNKVWEYKKQDD